MKYPKAPITEAVFDIKIDKLNIQGVESLLQIKELLKIDFPVEKKQHNFTSMFQFSPDHQVENKTQSNHLGYTFLSKDSSRQIQVRMDGFTLNVLRPYEEWEIHFETFMKYWNEYNKFFNPNSILKIATRFINRIEIPLPFESFQEFITNMPPIPTCLPQSFVSFFMQIQVPCNDKYRKVIITETIEPEQQTKLPFILDIDAFQELKVDKTEDNLRENFNELRNIKNSVFENCITDKTRQLFL
jgi:uncharacterized protein (TIGR04255 family)